MMNEIIKLLKNEEDYEVYVEDEKIYVENDWGNQYYFEKNVREIVSRFNGGDESKITVNSLKNGINQLLLEINFHPVKKFNCFGYPYYS